MVKPVYILVECLITGYQILEKVQFKDLVLPLYKVGAWSDVVPLLCLYTVFILYKMHFYYPAFSPLLCKWKTLVWLLLW